MQGRLAATSQVVRGIQFKVLGHAFPVLRHDAIKPISNAKLATVMLAQRVASADPDTQERSRELLADLDLLLDEGVDALRSLDAWLRDDAETVRLDEAINESRKLVFTHLFTAGKRIRLADAPGPFLVAKFPARYVLLAWLLHAVDAMPDSTEMLLECPAPGQIQASLPTTLATAKPLPAQDQPDAVHWPEVEQLARFYGWQVGRAAGCWRVQAPSAG